MEELIISKWWQWPWFLKYVIFQYHFISGLVYFSLVMKSMNLTSDAEKNISYFIFQILFCIKWLRILKKNGYAIIHQKYAMPIYKNELITQSKPHFLTWVHLTLLCVCVAVHTVGACIFLSEYFKNYFAKAELIKYWIKSWPQNKWR